jgi:hypothetical protein
MFPSVCWAARPSTIAVKAPPTARVPASRPAIRSATAVIAAMVSSRIRKPTVPATAGSRRQTEPAQTVRELARERPSEHDEQHHGHHPHGRPEAWEQLPALAEQNQDQADQREQHEGAPAYALSLRAIDLGSKADLAPDLGTALEGVAGSPSRPAEHGDTVPGRPRDRNIPRKSDGPPGGGAHRTTQRGSGRVVVQPQLRRRPGRGSPGRYALPRTRQYPPPASLKPRSPILCRCPGASPRPRVPRPGAACARPHA